MDGAQARLGVGLRESEGAPCGLSVCTERPHRGGQAGLIAWVEGLQGLPEALEAGCPTPQGPRGLVPQGRHSLQAVPWKERRAVAAALRVIEGATPLAAAAPALERGADRWDSQDPASSPRWLAAWARLPVGLDSPPAIRRAVSTTQASESFNDARRQVLPGRRAFPQDESLSKVG